MTVFHYSEPPGPELLRPGLWRAPQPVHGADYDIDGHADGLVPVEEVDGTRYVTALTGTLVEDIIVNAEGRADNCTGNNGALEERKQTSP